ncbi:MAG: S8 family serine peptidase [Dehalobacter sp.]|nr:S8 family serine peptidase [Dehalobacter sp.]
MNKITGLILKLFIALFLITGVVITEPTDTVKAAEAGVSHREEVQILVKYKDDTKADSVKTKVKKNLNLAKLDSKYKKKQTKTELLEISQDDDIAKVVKEFKKDTNVVYAQPNYKLNLYSATADERFNEEWGLFNAGQAISGVAGTPGIDIGAESAWTTTEGSSSVLVGVLDTGIDTTHPDLNGNIVSGYNFITDSSNVFSSVSSDSHGTHVAGIIAAEANSAGIKGVAPGVKIVPLKFIQDGTGYTSDAIEAIEYASSHGIKIINCSFGCSEENLALKDAMAQSAILFVCAAGNDASVSPVYPAAFNLPNIISVAAINNTGNLASFSSYGTNVDVAAPGVGILSTLPDGNYGYISGTSAAAPYVSGIAALIESAYPGLTPAQVNACIKNSVVALDSLTGKVTAGGIVNADKALKAAAAVPANTAEQTTKDDTTTAKTTVDSTVTTLAATISQQNMEQIHYGENGVNAATGNYAKTVTDFSLSSPGFTVDISRTYNSKDTRTSSTLGKGWFFGFEGSFTQDTTYPTQWVAKLPNGSAQVFVNNSGVFTANDSHSTMVKQADNSYILTTKDQYTYGFNTSGYLCWMKDRNGNTITIEVNATGKVQKVTDAAGRFFTVTYNAAGYITTVTDPMNRTFKYGYDASNRLTTVTDPSDTVIATYTYDSASGCLASIKDASSNILETLTYTNSSGTYKVNSYAEPDGKVSTYTYDTANSKTTITDANGRQIIKWYDSCYYVTKTQDPEGKTATVEYNLDANGTNKYGEEIAITDRYGNKTQYQRDSMGNMTKIINPDTSYSTYTYDAKNNLISETDELSHSTYYVYDTNSANLLKKIQPLNGTDTYSADANQTKFAITTYVYYSDAERTSLGYPALGLLKAETDPEGNTTTYTYDEYGNKASVTDPEHHVTQYTYNKNGWLTLMTSPSGYKTTYTYDPCGRVEKIELNNKETTRIVYDAMGRKTLEVAPNQYDLTKDGLNSQAPTHNYSDTSDGMATTYSASGRVLSQTDPCGNTTTYTYDVYGNLATETKPNGSVYIYTYDVMNRLTKISFKNLSTDTTAQTLKEYAYSVVSGKLQKTETVYLNDTDRAVTVTTYDYRGNVVNQKNPDGGNIVTVYYSNGLVKSVTDANGGTTYIKYDGLNRFSEKWSPLESDRYSYSAVTYDRAGNKTAEKTGKDKVELYVAPSSDRLMITSYTYDKDGKVKQVTDSTGAKKIYQYDPDGFVKRQDIYTSENTVNITEYQNDQRGNPTKIMLHVSSADIYGSSDKTGDTILTTTNAYDKSGNLSKTIEPDSTVTTYTYDTMNRLLTKTQDTLDENGARTTATIEVMGYTWNGKEMKTKDALGNITEYAYDQKGRLIKTKKTTTDPSHTVTNFMTAYEYDRADRLIREVPPANYTGTGELTESVNLSVMNRSEYTYDLMSRVIVKKDVFKNAPADTSWITIVAKAYRYDLNGNVIKEMDGRGYEAGSGSTDADKIRTGYGTEYTYNYANLKTKVLDAVAKEKGLSYTVSYQYDGALRNISETDAKGAITEYSYDNAGRILQVSIRKSAGDAAAVIKTSKYDLAGNLIAQTDGNGSTTTYIYNALNKVRKAVYPADASIPSYTVTYLYDISGNLAYQEDSMGTVDLYTYDQQGRQLTHTQQAKDGTDAITTSLSYDLNGNKIYVTDGNGTVTTNSYDGLNRLVSTEVTVHTAGSDEAVVNKIVYTYDKNNNPMTVTKYLNNVSTGTYTSVYDPINRLIQKEDPYTIIQKLKYNSSHQQTESWSILDSTAQTFAVTKYTYDKNNRLVSTTDPEGHATRQSYDNVGNIATKTDGNNNVTYYSYDQFNNLIAVTNAKGEKTTYTYDLNKNMTSQTDGKGNTTNYEYNCANKLVRKIDAGGRTGAAGSYTYTPTKTESYTYYANGSLAAKTDRNGVTFTYIYDTHGRKISERAKDIVISFTYDGNNNLLTMTDTTGKTARTYDELNRVLTKTLEGLGANTYQYDITADMPEGFYAEKATDLKGNITLKIFDKAGRLKEVRTDGQTTGTVYEYYPNGAKKSVTYADGSSEQYTYYSDNLLNTLTNYKTDNSVMDSYTYTYDAAHNQTSKTEILNGVSKGTTSYVYDKLNRLLKVTEPAGKVTEYTYDKAGNRETETVTDGTTRTFIAYAYNEQNRLISTTKQEGDLKTTTKYGYDNNGNNTSKLTEQIRKIDPINPPTPHFGMFIPGQEKDGATQYAEDLVGFAQYFEYDVFNQMIKSNTGNAMVEYTYYGDGLRATKTTNDQTTRFIYEGDKVVLELDGKGNQFARNVYGTNLLSRIVGGQTLNYMYNGHGDVTALLDNSGTIQATYYYDAFGNITSQTGTVDNPFTYAGYYYDKESGLYYLNARMYDPSIARFMQEDTYRGDPNDPLSLNLYTYCHNEPLMYTDPSGNNWISNLWNNVVQKATQAKTAIVTKATEVKTAVVNKYTEVKTAVVNKYTEAKTTVVNKSVEIKTAVAKKSSDIKATAVSKAEEVKATVSEKVNSYCGTSQNDPVSVKIVHGLENLISNNSPLGNWIEAATGTTLISGETLSSEQKQAKLNNGFKLLNEGLVGLGTGGMKGAKVPNIGTSALMKSSTSRVVGNLEGASSAEAKTLYHYTNEKGLNGIIESNQLNPSLKAVNPKDARYGNGQYLTDIVPGTKTPGQLSNTFYGFPFRSDRVTHFVEVDVTGLNVVKGREGVFVIPNENPLDLTNRIINSGVAPK